MIRPLALALLFSVAATGADALEPREFAEALARKHQEGDHLGALEQLRNELPNKELANEANLLVMLRGVGAVQHWQVLDEQTLHDRVRDVLLLFRFDRAAWVVTYGFVKLGDGWRVTHASYGRAVEGIGPDLRAYGGRTVADPLPVLDEALAAHKTGKHQEALDRLRPASARPDLPPGAPDPIAMQDARTLAQFDRIGPLTDAVILDDVQLGDVVRRVLVLYASATQSLLAQYSFARRGNDWRTMSMMYGFDPTTPPLKQISERR
ncbi:MAG: hypothetical protein JWM77_3420 [Rhodospirillales bacterium]|nr:hypothetical protein [Rhodospirillales bacterium]